METTRAVQHTPAPWVIQDDNEPWTAGNAEIAVEEGEQFGPVEELFSIRGGEDGDEHTICRIEWEFGASDGRQKEIRANARLIASAPELLEALADLVDQLEGIGIPDCHGAEGLSLDKAQAALARAPYYS
jgi:hypothetical protein